MVSFRDTPGMSLLSSLFSNGFEDRPDNLDPRRLLVRADNRALKQQRQFLLDRFGLEETISQPTTRTETITATKKTRMNETKSKAFKKSGGTRETLL